MVGRLVAGRRLVTIPFHNWVFVPAVTAMFLLGNGVGRVVELVADPPYQSEGVSVHPSGSEICSEAIGNQNGDDWCVVEVREADRYPGGHWFVEIDHVTTGETECGGSGRISVKPIDRRALVMWLSFYVGQDNCQPRLPFVMRTVRIFDERIAWLGVTWGVATWRVESPVSDPAG